MPLTPEQQTALDALKGVDPQELADAFHATHGRAAQLINDGGDAAATKRAGTEYRKLEKKLETAQQEAEQAKTKLAESDPAKVHEQYQTEIRDLTTRHADEVKQLRASGVERELGRDLAHLEARLSTRLKPMALRAVLRDPDTVKQFQYGEDGARTVLQRGKDIPYAPSRGQDVLDLLAEDLVESVKAIEPDSVIVKASAGGGSGSGSGGGTASDPVASYANKRFAPPPTAKPAAS